MFAYFCSDSLRSYFYQIQEEDSSESIIDSVENYFYASSKENNIPNQGLKSYWQTQHVIVSYLMLITTFMVRNISRDYSLLNEAMWVSGISFIFFFAQDLGTYLYDGFTSICAGPFPITMVLYTIRHLMIVLVVMIHPLRTASRQIIPLPPSIAVDDLKFFLVDESYFIIFYKYLETLEHRSMAQKSERTFGSTYI